MTKVDYIKCLDDLRSIRERIKSDYKRAADLTNDKAASEAYSLAIELEVALEKLLAPWEG